MYQLPVAPFRGTSAGWRNGMTMISSSSVKGKVLPLGRNNRIHQYTLGADWADKQLCREDLGLLLEKLTISQQYVLVVKQANSRLSCVRKSVTSRSKEVILPICSALVRCIWGAVSSSELPSTRESWTYWSDSLEDD